MQRGARDMRAAEQLESIITQILDAQPENREQTELQNERTAVCPWGRERRKADADCCLTCKKLEYRKNYVYPYRCLLNKAERFSEDECLRRVMEVYKCDKYEEADLDDYCSRGEKKGVTE